MQEGLGGCSPMHILDLVEGKNLMSIENDEMV